MAGDSQLSLGPAQAPVLLGLRALGEQQIEQGRHGAPWAWHLGGPGAGHRVLGLRDGGAAGLGPGRVQALLDPLASHLVGRGWQTAAGGHFASWFVLLEMARVNRPLGWQAGFQRGRPCRGRGQVAVISAGPVYVSFLSSRLRVSIQWEPPTVSGVSIRGGSSFR